MDILIQYSNWIWIAVWFAILFVGAKFCKFKEWNEDAMSFSQTKAILGFCAFGIVLHHCAEHRSAFWLPQYYIKPGLEKFILIGHLLVAIFLFFSGFGMYKSAKNNKASFDKYFFKRYVPILIPFFLTFAGFVALAKKYNVRQKDILQWHPYAWYIYCILVLYLVFMLGFRFIKKDWFGILIVALGTIGWNYWCMRTGRGTWWYNTSHMFLIGILVSKFEKGFTWLFKKLHAVWVILFIIITWLGYQIGYNMWGIVEMNHLQMTEAQINNWSLAGQCISSISVAFLAMAVSLKVKIGNPVNKFLGTITLELYLVHGLFVEIFGPYIILERAMSKTPIRNIFVYVIVVFAVSVPLAWLVSLGNKHIKNLLTKPKAS